MRAPARFLATVALALALAVVAGSPGCGGDEEDNPFVGQWVSATAGRLTFTDSTWADGEGDSGTYSYSPSGEDRVYSLSLVAGSGTYAYRATFTDANTLELCAADAPELCDDFVFDRPTLH